MSVIKVNVIDNEPEIRVTPKSQKNETLKIKVVDNDSEIKVIPKSQKDEVHLKANCKIKEKILLAKIEDLQRTKQDLGFIPLDEYLINKIIPEEYLKLLSTYLINKISVENNIYSLVESNSIFRKYICFDLEVELNQIDINIDTGEFVLKKSLLDHASLKNLDYLNSGHTGFAGIEFGTTAEWNSKPNYVPVKGMIVVYTDYKYNEELGEYIPAFKIGNGNAYLNHISFTGDDIRESLDNHINNYFIHVSAEDRERWDNKLNYKKPVDDLLELTRN